MDAAPAPTPTPTPALNIQFPTSCSTADGAWIIGLDNGILTFIRVRKSQSSPTVYTEKNAIKDTSAFAGGKCFEASPDRVYFITEALLGYLSIPNEIDPPKWTDITNVPTQIKEGGRMVPNLTAVGRNSAGTIDPTVVAAIDNNLFEWDTATSNTTPFSTLAELKLEASSIIDMAISTGSTPPNAWIWIYHKNDANQLQLSKYTRGADGLIPIPTAPTSPQTLAPLTSGNGIALLEINSQGGIIASYFLSNGTTFSQTFKSVDTSILPSSQFVVSETEVFSINPNGAMITHVVDAPNAPGQGSPTPVPDGRETPKKDSEKSQLPVIIGSVAGIVVLIAIIAIIVLIRRRKSKGRRPFFGKKQKDLFPAKADDTLMPLGIYHQDRSLPDVPKHMENDSGRPAYGSRPGDMQAQAKHPENGLPLMTHHSHNRSQTHIDETIPMEAALMHHSHDKHTPQGLTHSISVRSTTSNFPRRSAKTGKRFEEKIQLQVIRYEVQDAHLISPHGPTGRLVLGTYHIISPPRSARSSKAQGGASQGIARSGTVLVRRSRLGSPTSSGRNSPQPDMAEDSSMLLTDAENQHTFEAETLKWYMTEYHWKREAALLKHLKSPIFVMELMESYCIPALQSRAYTYPFVNVMSGCSSLLSDVGPIKTAQHARAILRSISAAVEWCHRHGVVHLNIQPGSFFLEDGIDPKTEDASWKLWDFTCARFMGEPIGKFGGGGGNAPRTLSTKPQPPPNHLHPEAYPFLEQRQHEEQMDRTGGNPLPAAYTAPELLEAWRAGDTNFAAEATMDTWSLGCVYYEVLLGGQPLFKTETEAWGLIGGWENRDPWTANDFRVPYPPSPSPADSASIAHVHSPMDLASHGTSSSDGISAYERSQALDPSGSIAQLLRDMMSPSADDRVSLETIMERIY
ncbi:hypothetical protein BG011_004117 [Mortierella polycephala]|uniref:Protein kinase domain-containing protein n=1 Tax=Mortierella polycephala TaxID=41804 RepID=A0A9P6QCT6_9FUNG|nr:hypothetical protein BG011_004117 [Mortierella polycephala]